MVCCPLWGAAQALLLQGRPQPQLELTNPTTQPYIRLHTSLKSEMLTRLRHMRGGPAAGVVSCTAGGGGVFYPAHTRCCVVVGQCQLVAHDTGHSCCVCCAHAAVLGDSLPSRLLLLLLATHPSLSASSPHRNAVVTVLQLRLT